MSWLRSAMMAVVAVAVIGVSFGEESDVLSVAINTRNVINHLSGEFVSFSAEPQAVFADSVNPVNERSFQMAKNLGPMFLKVFCDSSQLELQVEEGGTGGVESLVQITPKGWKAFAEWAKQAGVMPIFVVDYDVASWKPKNALRVLTIANKLGIEECLWQLGSGNITNAVKYIEDLRAFQAIVKAFKFRGVVASDVSVTLAGVEQARYFNFNVDDIADVIAVSYTPLSDDSSLQQFVVQRESHLRGPARSNLPVWLDVKLPQIAPQHDGSCDQDCLLQGLHYATLLGDAAHNGFAAVFKSLEREEIQSYSFSYVIASLHRALVGSKVFDVPQGPLPGVRVNAYCSYEGNGSVTLLVVNHRPEGVELDFKVSTKQYSTEVQHYVVTVANGQILLNYEPYDYEGSLKPMAKIHTLLKGLRLNIPAFSLAFYVLPNLNVKECTDDYHVLEAEVTRSNVGHHSSVHQLLQELIAERSLQDITQLSRRKRALTDELAEVLEDKLNEPLQNRAAKNPARRARQTKNYRRKQQTIRRKEKRNERRNLKRQKQPLRERGKRQLRRKNFNANRLGSFFTSKKTKRSFLAEAVDQPPVFGSSREDEMNRSSFPQGDVHLLISKGQDGESFLSIEEAPFKDERPGKSRKKKLPAVKAPSLRDLRFVVPELMFNQPKASRRSYSSEIDAAASISMDRYIPLDTSEGSEKVLNMERELIEIGDLKVREQSVVTARQEDSTTVDSLVEPDVIDEDSFYYQPEKKSPARRKTTTEATMVVEPIQESVQEDEEERGEEFDIFTELPELDLSLMNGNSEEEEDEQPAIVEEIRRRRKRSVSSSEIDRIEAFFMNNTQLQQKFAEMFDSLLETFQCCGESGENTAEEDIKEGIEEPVGEEQEQQLERTKRNALLHPGSWESRERTNLLHQQRTSAESAENMIPTEPVTNVGKIREKVKRKARLDAGLSETSGSNRVDTDDGGRPGVVMLRQVTNFLKGMSTEMHRMFSTWFPKTSKE